MPHYYVCNCYVMTVDISIRPTVLFVTRLGYYTAHTVRHTYYFFVFLQPCLW